PFESAEIGPSWFDNGHLHGSGPVGKLLHDVWTASPWLPTWSVGVGTFDGTLKAPYDGVPGVDFLFPLAMLTHVTFWTDLRTLTPSQRTETAWWIAWYRSNRDSLGPAVYELTDRDPLDEKSWAAWQPWNGTGGYVFAFRPAGAPATATFALQGLDPAAHYKLIDVRTGANAGVHSGAELASGLPLELAPASAAVLSVQPVGSTAGH
ncbi:MAG: alpha-galactosidase, partial [Frankiaceae bacterium]|nr:alpha-galactosidase [Frankiaceae bacterium]